MLSFKANMRYSKKYCNKQVHLCDGDYVINYNENKGENEK